MLLNINTKKTNTMGVGEVTEDPKNILQGVCRDGRNTSSSKVADTIEKGKDKKKKKD